MPGSGLTTGYRAFRLPRRGYSLDECQDASAGDAERGRFAIADGAAESPNSAQWAHLLVEEFVRQTERGTNWTNWLPSLQARWSTALRFPLPALRPLLSSAADNGEPMAESGQRMADSGTSVPWYLEPGLNQGAFATFLGLVIEEAGWHALAVGDSCLFQVRHDELGRAFPLTRSAEFSNAPWLVGSRAALQAATDKNGVQQDGDWQPGDRFWLMTDALAHWFLKRVEEGGKPWLALETLLSADDGAFAAWIEDLRSARLLRNDDVTLLAISV